MTPRLSLRRSTSSLLLAALMALSVLAGLLAGCSRKPAPEKDGKATYYEGPMKPKGKPGAPGGQ